MVDDKHIEKYLGKLMDIEKRLDNGEDDDEFLNEVDGVLTTISGDMYGVIETTPKLGISYINASENPDPDFTNSGNSGFDIRANDSLWVTKGDVAVVPTGLSFEIPEGFELQIRPRSGLSAKYGIGVMNSPGTVDSNYRGDVKVLLFNITDKPFFIDKGDRIAQGVFQQILTCKTTNFIKKEILSETERGEKGFGSSGIK